MTQPRRRRDIDGLVHLTLDNIHISRRAYCFPFDITLHPSECAKDDEPTTCLWCIVGYKPDPPF